ncbi:methyltransferase [Nostoc sp. LEGE 12447]|nr:methyltransferase [Nostoc sp. LEGE 12447]
MMNTTTSMTIQKPKTDELLLWNLIFADTGRQVLLVAYDIKLFPLLSQKPRSLAEICDELKIFQRPAEAVLAVLISIELVELENSYYSLTPLAKDYLVESSPTYFGALLEMMIFDERKHISSFDTLKKSLFTNNSPSKNMMESLSKNHDFMRAITFGNNVKFIRSFISSMHGPSMAAALIWPELIDLSEYKLFIDIGGGSAAHSIGATSKWPNLQAVVLELPTVCEIAQEFIIHYGLQNRIATQDFDMWSDPFPVGDLHFYSAIYHHWQQDKCQILTKKSFNSLLSGGRIILHEMLFNEQKTGPFPVAVKNLNISLKLGGQQYSGQELSMMLEQAGFIDIEIKPASSYWSIITGRKP